MDLNNTTTPLDEKDLAQTPPEFIKAIEAYFGITFTLDVCANQATAKVENYYSLDERDQDGLRLPWGKVSFCNPPYSDVLPWVQKAKVEALLGNTSYLLIPDKPEVGYIQYCHRNAFQIWHMPWRLNFIRPSGQPFLDKQGKKQGPKFPVCIVIFSPKAKAEARHFYLPNAIRAIMKKIKAEKLEAAN